MINRRGFLASLVLPFIARFIPKSEFTWDKTRIDFYDSIESVPMRIPLEPNYEMYFVSSMNLVLDNPRSCGVITGISEVDRY